MAKHTGGKWKLGPETEGYRHISGAGWKNFARVCVKNDSIPVEEAEANAQLLVTAPRLLEAAELLCLVMSGDNEALVTERYHALLAVIREAKGG